MKKIIFSFSIVCAICISAQAQGLKNISFGSLSTGNAAYNGNVECSYADNAGNIFLAGAYDNTSTMVDFDLFNPVTTSFGPTGNGLVFYFSKYNSIGVLQFTKMLISNSTAASTDLGIRGIVTDATGNIYIAGTFNATVDFDPSGATYNLSTSTGKTFMAKYDSNGLFLWARNLGGVSTTTNTVVPEDIAINPTTGNVFIAGWYISNGAPNVDFDPGVTNTNTLGMMGAKCGFFAAYNSTNGNYVANSMWGAINNSFNSVDYVNIKSIAFDNSNNIYAVGNFRTTLISTGSLNFPYATIGNAFIVKKPTTTSGNTADDIAVGYTTTTFYDIAMDASNNVFAGGNNTTSGLVIKYNSSLVTTWSKYPTINISSIDVNSSNQIYAVGTGPGAGIFAQLYNSSGTTNFGAGGLSIPLSSGFIQAFTQEVQVAGSNVILGGYFYNTGSPTYNYQDLGFNYDTNYVFNNTNKNYQFWGIYTPDFFGPIANITTTALDPTTVSPIPLTITFDEKANGFNASAFGTNNANISNLIQTGAVTYTADLTPIAPGLAECEIFGAQFYDYQNNPNQGSNYFSITYNLPDIIPPTVIISSTSSNPTNISPIPVTFTFSENVTGFTVGDITVTNGTAGSFVAVSGSVYTANITPTAQGTVNISVAANVCVDGSSNQNTASSLFTRVYDSVAPTVIISSASSNPTNVSPIPVTFTFNETVTGFTLADITVANGTAGSFVAVSGTIYTANITPTAQGTVNVSVAANVCVDGATNQNTASALFSRLFDSSSPSVVISSTSSNPTNVSPIPVTFTFNESVTGFTLADITVVNGTAGSFVAVSGTVYTANITPTAQGTVTVNVAANVCVDGATNQNTASALFTRLYDSVSPTVTITSTAGDPTNVSPIPVTFTFVESVIGFTQADITLSNGTAGNFVAVSGSVYTADITPTSLGLVTVSLTGNVCTDAALNQNSASALFTRTYNNVSPTVTISSTASDPTNISPIPVTFTFSASVTGFTVGDITVSNGTAGSFVAVSGTVYTANITPIGQGLVTVSVASGVCMDGASNPNTASNSFTRIFDSASPSLVITSTSSNPTNVSPISVTFTFNENVSGFTVVDITVTNGTAGGFIAVSGMIYTANITPSAQGTVTVSVAANVCTDGATNQNSASALFTRTFDNASPTLNITSTTSDPTNVSPIPVTFTFSETVTGFTLADIGVSNGTAGSFVAVSGTVYTANITPTAQGTVTVNVAANVCMDGASNQNTASSIFSRLFDNTTPTAVISSLAGDPTNVSPIPIIITFNEPVVGFTISDIGVLNGTAGNFVAVSGSVYTADITPTAQGLVTVSIAANVCTDGASNQNLASALFTRTYNNVSPTVTISSTASDPTNVSPIPVTITFSAAVTGFTITDITVSNGAVGNFVALSGTVYTADITPSAQGIVTVSIASGVCVDGALNQNTASNSFTRTFDSVSPSVLITSTAGDPTSVSPIPVTITFDENVNGFTLADLIISNGTAGNFVAVSGMVYTVEITPTAQGLVTVDVPASVCMDDATNPNGLALPFSITYTISTSIAVAESNFESNLFPNPNNGNFIVNSDWAYSNGIITIYDMTGRICFSKDGFAGTAVEIHVVLEPGIYLFVVSDEIFSFQKQIIIEK